MKRCLSFVLAILLVLSCFGGIQISAASKASYNSGKRDQVCTELSPAAEAYYTGSYDYDTLSSLSGSSLRSKLRTLITSDRSTVGYGGLKTYFPYTDAYEGSSSKLRLFYCDGTTTSNWDSGATWNREHMWPDSKGGSAMEGDLHAMRPTDPKANSTRNSNKYGYVSGGKTAYSNEKNGEIPAGTYASGLFEPLDFSKGDCARTILYDYVVTSSMSSVGIVFTDEKTLLEWCALDPVDTYEMSRNDVAQEIQGCRNPFVDYPELAWLILGESIPAGLTTPSGGEVVTYTIKATSNNTSYGTVKLSGRVITATPATGCYVEGYTVVSGTATVTREGDVFTVSPKSDCTVRINFAKKTTVTVSFNGGAAPVTAYAGEGITLPQGPVEDGYRFVGWTEKQVAPTTAQPVYYTAGSTYVPTASVNFYPLYTYSEGNGGDGWTLLTDAEGLYVGAKVVFATTAKGKVAGDLTSTILSAVDQTFSDDLSTIPTLSDSALVLILGGSAEGWTLSNEAGQLLGVTSVKNLAWDKGTTTWTITAEGTGFKIASTNGSYGRFLYNSSATRFTTYTSNVSTTMLLPQIYINGGGTMYYTTELTRCDHSSASYSKAVPATCTAQGNVEYYTCNDCGKFFADASCTQTLTASQLVIPATGHTPGKYAYDADGHWELCSVCGSVATDVQDHSWDDGKVTTQPTETAMGVLTYTCGICSATKTESIPALGGKLTLSFSVPKGANAVASITGYKGDTVTLPDGADYPEGDYSFVGWTLETVEDRTTSGAYYTPGQKLTLEQDLSFKALYRYAVDNGEGCAMWTIVTDTAQLTDGSRVVLAANTKDKVAGMLSSQYLTTVEATFSADGTTIKELPDDALILTLGSADGMITLADSEGQLLGATAVKKLAWNNGTTTWTVEVEEGKATISNGNSSYGRFLYNVNSPRFTTYLSSANTTMLLPQLYTLKGGATIYYTTEPGESEKPQLPQEPTVDAAITIGHSLNLASDISINYAVPATLLAGYDRYRMDCILPVYEGNTLAGTRIVSLDPVLNGSYYYFTLNGVTAVNMNDTITATLYMFKGQEAYASKTDTYSVAQYAYSQLGKIGIAESLKALCADLLRYGSAAQIYKGYRTDALADGNMTAAQKAYLTDMDAVSFGNHNSDLADLSAPKVQWVGKSLLLDSKVTLRYVVDVSGYGGRAEDLILRISYRDLNGETKTATVSGPQPYGSTAGRYSFDFDGLLAAELRTVLHAAVYSGATRLSSTLEYSVDTYGNNKEGALETLCRALMAYSDTARAFFSE